MNPLFGLDAQVDALLGAAASGRMHHGWILAGPKGIGKATLARAVATRLLAEAADPALTQGGDNLFGDPAPPTLRLPEDHRIARLVEAGSHPDFVTLRRLPREDRKKGKGEEKGEEPNESDLRRNISVDQVRGLHRLLNNRPALSDRRVVVIDAADDLERPAANALLKSLEEPPAGTLFLLISHAPGRLLPTIRSRCRLLPFKPLDRDDVASVIGSLMPDADAAETAALVQLSHGSPGRALQFAGLGIAEIDAALAQIAATGDPDNGVRLKLAKSLSPKSASPRYEAFLERAPAFIVDAARTRRGEALATAISAWEDASQLAGGAVAINLDPAATVFELCSQVARLAPARAAA